MSDIKRIPIKEFRDTGFLQEANRLFFHALGLALEVEIADEPETTLTLTDVQVGALKWLICEAISHKIGHEGEAALILERLEKAPRVEAGVETLGGIWDYREDPEGITYGDDQLSEEKADRVEAERLRHVRTRRDLFFPGYGTIAHPDDGHIQPIPARGQKS